MADEREIISEIETAVGSNFDPWTIGLTDDPTRKLNERGNPAYWKHWQADSEDVARSVHEYFVKLGMKSDAENEGELANYVYVF